VNSQVWRGGPVGRPAPTNKTAAMTDRAYRRAAGALLGLLLGFAYAAVSQLINRLALPGIPLYQPPLGPLGNILLGALAGAALGLISSWPDSAAWGIFLGGAAAAAAVVANGLIRLATEGAATLVVGLFLSVPMVWLAVPVIALLRWAVGKQVAARREAVPLLRRLWLPLVLALVMGILAGFELYSADAQTELRQAEEMVQAGLRAADAAGLPAPLRVPRVVGFPAGKRAGYTLEWTDRELDRFIELRPAGSYDRHAAVIAHFDGGPTVVCLYPTPKAQPNCGTY
jgi:hypothetical protein